MLLFVGIEHEEPWRVETWIILEMFLYLWGNIEGNWQVLLQVY